MIYPYSINRWDKDQVLNRGDEFLFSSFCNSHWFWHYTCAIKQTCIWKKLEVWKPFLKYNLVSKKKIKKRSESKSDIRDALTYGNLQGPMHRLLGRASQLFTRPAGTTFICDRGQYPSDDIGVAHGSDSFSNPLLLLCWMLSVKGHIWNLKFSVGQVGLCILSQTSTSALSYWPITSMWLWSDYTQWP